MNRLRPVIGERGGNAFMLGDDAGHFYVWGIGEGELYRFRTKTPQPRAVGLAVQGLHVRAQMDRLYNNKLWVRRQPSSGAGG